MESYTLITGATGGLGKEFTMQCAARGDNLFLTGRSGQRLDALRAEVLQKYPQIGVITCPCMLNDEASRDGLFAFAREREVKLSRLIYVAGVDTQMAFESYTEQKLVFQVRVNLEAAMSVTRGFLELCTENAGILAVGSMSGTCPMPYFAVYSATKAAVTSFFTALRVELKGRVKVTTLMPGGIPTRPDIINDIKIQGLKGKLSSKPKAFVVKKALKGAEKGKRIVIPGAFNKLTYFITKITPVSWQTAFVAKNWKNKQKDAF